MENNGKKKALVKLAGVQLTLVTDENDAFVAAVEETVNERMTELTRQNYRVNKTDAALLCAVDFCSDKLKAEEKAAALEAQAAVYEADIRRLREELAVLKGKAEESHNDADTADEGESGALDMDQLGDMIRATGDEGAENKIRTLVVNEMNK